MVDQDESVIAGIPLVKHERTTRILTAAADLLVRWGYKRVTMEDIATQAGVGTGTVYLHWKTKEALFETVLLRELVAIWRVLLQRIRADPSEVLLHRFMGALLLSIKQRPLACALFTRDITLLGKLTQSRIAQQSQQMTSSNDLIILLRDLGLVRSDMDIDIQAYAFSALWTGFSQVDQFLAADDRVPFVRQCEALAATIRRAFEPDILPDLDILQRTVAPTMITYLEHACEFFERQIEERLLTPRDT